MEEEKKDVSKNSDNITNENNTQENPVYFGILPANVRYSKINANAKILYTEITALTYSNGVCWATNDYFAKLFNTTKRSITNWIKELENNKFIVCEYDNENSQNEKRWIYLYETKQMDSSTNKIANKTTNAAEKEKGLRNNEKGIEKTFYGVLKEHSREYRKNLPKGIERNFQHNTSNINTRNENKNINNIICQTSKKERPFTPTKYIFPCKPSKFHKDKTTWTLPKEDLDFYLDTYKNLNIEQELKKMLIWLRNNNLKTYSGMGKFVSSWLSRSNDSNRAKPNNNKISNTQLAKMELAKEFEVQYG